MKKKIMAWLAVVLAVCALAGCGGNDADVPLKDMDVDKYVTLGEYRGIEVSVAPITVDEAEWEEVTNEAYYSAAAASREEIVNGIMDREVEVGDIVNIDYEGKLDGVAFEGGTGEGFNLAIGGGQFIEGFEDGLVGTMPGDTVDIPLTFPEGYRNPEMAGQAVVFTVTVNCIVPEEMSEVFVPLLEIEGVNNLEELRQYVYDYLYSYDEPFYNSEVQSAVLNAFMSSCTFVEELPDTMLSRYETVIRANVEQEAGYYGMDADSYISAVYGGTLEDFLADYVPEALRRDLAFQAVANRENLNVSDEELNELLLEYATSAGYTSVEEFIGETSLEDYREYFMYDNVLNFLVENAKVIN